MFAPQAVAAQVIGNVINVTMTGVSLGLIPPPTCGIAVVGPFSRGNYQINYYLVRDAGPPSLQTTLSFAVADPIPTTTTAGIMMLTVILSIAALLSMMHRRHFDG